MATTQLVGGPLHGETVAVCRNTETIELDLGDGTFASYRLNAGGAWSYSGIRSDLNHARSCPQPV